nr:4435_t:CDS:2 [Entrophospora candida]
MKDQFDDLCIHINLREKIVRNLMTISFIHVDSPPGYICQISHSKMLTILSTVTEFGTRALPVIMLAWKAKEINDANDDEELQRSCDNNSCIIHHHQQFISQLVLILQAKSTPKKFHNRDFVL